MTYGPNSFWWKDDHLIVLDQRYLPKKEVLISVYTIEDCHQVMKEMAVRGAPAIGFCALYGLALHVQNNPNISYDSLFTKAQFLKTARPTAVNLSFEIDRILKNGDH